MAMTVIIKSNINIQKFINDLERNSLIVKNINDIWRDCATNEYLSHHDELSCDELVQILLPKLLKDSHSLYSEVGNDLYVEYRRDPQCRAIYITQDMCWLDCYNLSKVVKQLSPKCTPDNRIKLIDTLEEIQKQREIEDSFGEYFYYYLLRTDV